MSNALSDENPFEDLSYAEVWSELSKPYTAEQSNFEMVKEFHNAFSITTEAWPPKEKTLDLRMGLINEELSELELELYPFDTIPTDRGDLEIELVPDKQKVAKELADLLYVVYGTAATFGIDIDRVFAEVHRSNMSKLDGDGKPIYREDGKVLKGPNYQEAQLEFVYD